MGIKNINYDDVLNFWFSPINKAKWFVKDPIFDQEITDSFLEMHTLAAEGSLDNWHNSAEGTLALIIALDQFPRNMFRNSPQSFATDNKALFFTKSAINKQMDSELSNEYKSFIYMPLMHSENLDDQRLSVELFAKIAPDNNYAKMHMDIIDKFGRFPHRNKALGRKSTKEEMEFLTTPNSSF